MTDDAMRHFVAAFALSLCLMTAAASPKEWALSSPDVNISVNERIEYSVSSGEDIMIAPSEVAMHLSGGQAYDASVKFVRAKETSCDNTITTRLYRKAQVRDNYRQLTLTFSTFDLVFRAYASGKNVGIILWAGYLAFDSDMERVCRHYSEMGVRGFKVDFMDHDDQKMVAFHRRAAEMTARYGLMIDFHGTYKPTGLPATGRWSQQKCLLTELWP